MSDEEYGESGFDEYDDENEVRLSKKAVSDSFV